MSFFAQSVQQSEQSGRGVKRRRVMRYGGPWQWAAAGRCCPECGGRVKLRVEQRGRVERHWCIRCPWLKVYWVR